MAQERSGGSSLKEKFRRGSVVVVGFGAVTLLFSAGIGALLMVGGGVGYYLS